MIAYVFWHWKKPEVETAEYEKHLRKFHAKLREEPPKGFLDSFSVGFARAPWITSTDEAFEDWYLVENFGALGTLNEGVITGTRMTLHDAAAAIADGGTGGVYALHHGTVMSRPRFAHWFGKPPGMSYKECFEELMPLVDNSGGALWMRRMTLGPAKEFCLHGDTVAAFPPRFNVLVIPLREIWAGNK
ncbi:MAG TPA: hypothetical protein VLX91_13390 [Candidatus Acidoferrales bacterium]|nr:hypothetical protein [Candidatus Acidoferrales bacterium]